MASDGDAISPRTLSILTWEDYFPPELLERFTAETGIDIAYHFFGNSDELEGLLVSNPDRYDVIVVDDQTGAQLEPLGLLGPINQSKILNLKNIAPQYLDQVYDRGNKYSVPYLWGTTLIAYNSALLEGVEHSWSSLFDLEKLAGKTVYFVDEPADIFASALFYNNLPMNTFSEADLDKAAQSITSLIEIADVRFGDTEEVKEALTDGSCALALHYSGDALRAAEDNEDIRIFIPSEGAPIWSDNFTVSNEAPHPDLAHAFINFMSSKEAATECANYNWCGSPNHAAMAMLDEELLSDPSVFPPAAVLARCEFYTKERANRPAIMLRHMRSFKQRASTVATLPEQIH